VKWKVTFEKGIQDERKKTKTEGQFEKVMGMHASTSDFLKASSCHTIKLSHCEALPEDGTTIGRVT
jgi:hypothetical protein